MFKMAACMEVRGKQRNSWFLKEKAQSTFKECEVSMMRPLLKSSMLEGGLSMWSPPSIETLTCVTTK